jgi:hypothetical protein
MSPFDQVIFSNQDYINNFAGYTGNPPTNEAEYASLNCWKNKSISPSWADIQTKITEQNLAEQAAKDAKASALAKLTALGLTQAEVTALLG